MAILTLFPVTFMAQHPFLPPAIVPMMMGSTLVVCWSAIVPMVSFAQTSPTTTFDHQGSVDIFDGNRSREFNPLDIIHQMNFSRQDPLLFFEKQQENLNSEVLDFQSKQREQLREQGYQVPITPGDLSETVESSEALQPSEDTDEVILLEVTPDTSNP